MKKNVNYVVLTALEFKDLLDNGKIKLQNVEMQKEREITEFNKRKILPQPAIQLSSSSYMYMSDKNNSAFIAPKKKSAISTTCNKCTLEFVSYKKLVNHYNVEHPGEEKPKQYYCTTCDFTAEAYFQILKHMVSHENIASECCYHCDEMFIRKKSRTEHIINYHQKSSSQYYCISCPFKSMVGLMRHKREVHSAVHSAVLFECEQCSRRFNLKANLNRHIKMVHLQLRNFICQHCNKAFAANTSRRLHIQTVHMKIPYPPWNKKKRNAKKELKED